MDERLVFSDGNGNYGYKVQLSDRIWFNEKDGYLYCNDVVVGNVGVQFYKGYELNFADKNALIEVHREEADVFDEVSMDSLKGIPVTLRHPKKLLNSDTTSDHIKGALYGQPKRDGDNLITDMVIYDRELIDLVAPEDENGERKLSQEFRDLSLGYRAKLIPIKDKPNTYKQTNILYNHVAVLEAGRQVNAMIRDEANPELEQEVKKEGKPFMNLFRLKGRTVKRNDETKETVITDEQTEIEVDIEDAKRIISESMYHSIDKRESYDDTKKKIVTERVTKEVTTEEDEEDEKTKIFDEQNKELEKDKKETKDVEVKDKAYFVNALKEAQVLPDGEIKSGIIADLNKEFADAFPAPQKTVEVQDGLEKKVIKPVNTQELEKEIHDNETPKVDYQAFEAEARGYYRNLTDPFAHESWEAFNKNYNAEVRKGRSGIFN